MVYLLCIYTYISLFLNISQGLTELNIHYYLRNLLGVSRVTVVTDLLVDILPSLNFTGSKRCNDAVIKALVFHAGGPRFDPRRAVT